LLSLPSPPSPPLQPMQLLLPLDGRASFILYYYA